MLCQIRQCHTNGPLSYKQIPQSDKNLLVGMVDDELVSADALKQLAAKIAKAGRTVSQNLIVVQSAGEKIDDSAKAMRSALGWKRDGQCLNSIPETVQSWS